MKRQTLTLWERYGLTEFAYNMAWTAGYLDKVNKFSPKDYCTFKKGTNLRKVYDKGMRDAKKI